MQPKYATQDSRALTKAHPELQRAFEWLEHEYRRRYGNDVPQPFIIWTTRGKASQEKAKAGGYSQVDYGHSKHNVEPSLAFDIAMDDKPQDGIGNDAAWRGEDVELAYRRFGQLAEEIGLEWLDEIGDYGHIQLGISVADYLAGNPVGVLELPATAEELEELEQDFADAHITVLELPDMGAVVAALELIAKQQAETNEILRERL